VSFDKPEDFYQVYDEHRTYASPDLRKKHLRQYDDQIWSPAACLPEMAFLEIGCGTGIFLNYLKHKGVQRFAGVDLDPHVLDVMPADLAEAVTIGDVWAYLEQIRTQAPFDRIVLLDVLEHFSPYEGVRLLRQLDGVLSQDGRIIVRVPNLSSPWGAQYQFHDLTHKAMYTPGSLRQVALAAGFDVIRCLPQRRGSATKRFLEDCVHGLLSRTITEPPAIWSANMIGIIGRPKNSFSGE
jgi:cyclopropane fatty-acyl-phospholipid synthase-like methyltransferase